MESFSFNSLIHLISISNFPFLFPTSSLQRRVAFIPFQPRSTNLRTFCSLLCSDFYLTPTCCAFTLILFFCLMIGLRLFFVNGNACSRSSSKYILYTCSTPCIIYISGQQLPFHVPMGKHVSSGLQGKMEEPNLPLFFTDPELMENAQASKDTSTKPTTIAALNGVSRSMDFSLGYTISSTRCHVVRYAHGERIS